MGYLNDGGTGIKYMVPGWGYVNTEGAIFTCSIASIQGNNSCAIDVSEIFACSLADNQANDSCAINVSEIFAANCAALQGNDSCALSVSEMFTASINRTQANDAAAISVSEIFVGSAAFVEANMLCHIDCSIVSLDVTCSLALVQANDRCAIYMWHDVRGGVDVADSKVYSAVTSDFNHGGTITPTELSL